MIILILIIVISIIYYKYNNFFDEISYKRIYSIGTGQIKSNYENLGTLLSNNINYELEVKNSNGSIQNIQDLIDDKIDFALCQEEIAYDAISKLGYFEDKNVENISFVCGVYFELMHLMVKNKKSEETIKTINDLLKKNTYKLGIGPIGSGSYNNFFLIAKLYKLNPIKIGEKPGLNTIYYETNEYNELFNKFINNELDGLFIVSSPENIYIKNLVKYDNIYFINIQENTLLKNLYSNYFYKKDIDLSDYYNEIIKQDTIPTLASRAILLCKKDTPKKIIYNTIKTLFILQNEINKNNIYEYDPIEMAFCKNIFKLHPGAREYLEEINIITVDKTGDKEKEDLNYYADNVVKNYWNFSKIGIKNFKL